MNATVDRLNPLDAEFVYLEDDLTHLHIAAVCVFEGPQPSVDQLQRLIAGKLHLIPRYRQRVRHVPLDLGRPVWVDDPHFSLSYHLRHTALPAPGDDAALRTLMGRLMAQPLDRNRPLWEMWLVEGLSDDRWAVICKVHHCMVDGVSGVDLLTVLLDLDRDIDLTEPKPWSPAPPPSTPELVLDAWSGLACDVARRLGSLPAAVRDPLSLLREVRDDISGVITFGRKLGTVPPLSIEGTIGPHRVWAHAEVDFAVIKAIRAAFGGTVNDVVLAACAAGYRSLLEVRGDDVSRGVIKTLVPVSRRSGDAHAVFDNRVAALLYELPIAVDDPVERLAKVHDDMAELKASHMVEAGDAMLSLGDLFPPLLMDAVSRSAMVVMRRLPQRSVNTVCTNVPGPQFPLYCLGREMVDYYPFVPLAHGVRVGTAILSYNGRLSFGLTGDFDSISTEDLDVLATAIVDELQQLRDRAATAVSPERAAT